MPSISADTRSRFSATSRLDLYPSETNGFSGGFEILALANPDAILVYRGKHRTARPRRDRLHRPRYDVPARSTRLSAAHHTEAPKNVVLVRAAAEQAADILTAKREKRSSVNDPRASTPPESSIRR